MKPNKVIFKNPGICDVQALVTFGVSVKENLNPIGRFGTGFKYAIAVLLRNNQKIEVYCGKKLYKFSTKHKNIRGKSINIVCLNNKELGFTTDLGLHWEIWQAYRELYCNCLDESGEVILDPKDSELKTWIEEDTNTLVICTGEVFYNFARYEKHLCVLDTKPFFETKEIAIHPGETKFIFMQGIRVYEHNINFKCTYNILADLKLTEDRTIDNVYNVYNVLATLLYIPDLPQEIFEIICLSTGYAENQILWEYKNLPETVINRLKIYKHNQKLNKSFNRFFEISIKDLRCGQKIVLSGMQTRQLAIATEFLSNLNININKYPISFVELDKEILGCADMEKEEIYISLLCFERGIKILAGTILEEYIHLTYNVHDCTRTMQNILIDKIITLGELVNNQPL